MNLTFALVLALAAVGCNKEPESKAKPAATPPSAGARFDISVTENGFEPEDVKVPAGKPVTLVFDRKTDHTCAKEVIIKMADGTKIEKELPLNTPVEVATTFPTAGKLSYACGMDMVRGTLTVQ